MHIYIASDHRGFTLKKDLAQYLSSMKFVVKDVGNTILNMQDDYPDFVFQLVNRLNSAEDRGIVICGSGVGVSVAANRHEHIRCALGFDTKQITSARQEDDINVLALGADYITLEVAKELTHTFLTTQFKNEEKYIRRITKINEHTHGNCSGCTCQH